MKTTLITLALALPLLAARLAPCLAGAPPCAAPDPQAQDDEEHAETPLDAAMLTIEESLGALRRAVRDAATYPDALAALAVMEEATLRAKLLVPPMAAGVPEADRAAFVRDYRKMLVEMLTAQLACEAALLDGDGEAAKEAFKAIRAFEDAGHERFTEE